MIVTLLILIFIAILIPELAVWIVQVAVQLATLAAIIFVTVGFFAVLAAL